MFAQILITSKTFGKKKTADMSGSAPAAPAVLIVRDLHDVLDSHNLPKILAKNEPTAYWGTVLSRLHFGYMTVFLKIRDLVSAGCRVVILLADLHAFLDGRSTWEQLDSRAYYYKTLITAILKAMDVPVDRVQFQLGTDHQLRPEFVLDLYKSLNRTIISSALEAADSVITKQSQPHLGNAIYPLMQSLDERHVVPGGVDIELGNVDQLKIFNFSRQHNTGRVYLIHTSVPSLDKRDPKMIRKRNKIDFLDSERRISDKINKSSDSDTLFTIIRIVLCPLQTYLTISSSAGSKKYTCGELEKDFQERKISLVDLKKAITNAITLFSKRVKTFLPSDMNHICREAYPEKFPHLTIQTG